MSLLESAVTSSIFRLKRVIWSTKEICFFRSTPGLIRMPTTRRLANCSERRPTRNCRISPSNVKSVCKAPESLLRKTMIRHLPIRMPPRRSCNKAGMQENSFSDRLMESITQPVDVLGAGQPRRFVQIVAGTAALAGLLFGFDTGVISGAILFIKGAFGLTPLAEEVLVSAALVGAVCGSTLSGRFTDILGRKRAILITAAIFTVGSILCAVSGNIPVLIVGRLAVGIAIGVASYTAPLYISEMAPLNLRGALVTLNQLAIPTGILLAYVVDRRFRS